MTNIRWACDSPFGVQKNIRLKIYLQPKSKYPSQYAGMKSSAVPLSICKVCGKQAKDIENKPFSTNVPVLLINGEFDPDTPPSWGCGIAKDIFK
jgi:hypothetical protein